jgi:hypothetical protein
MTFLLASYQSGDLGLAKKVSQSLKSDLEQQMRYYRSLGDEGLTNEQLGMNAFQFLNQRPANLTTQQEGFAQDIASSYQLLNQLADWEKQFKAGGPPNAGEAPPTILKPADTTPKKPQ